MGACGDETADGGRVCCPVSGAAVVHVNRATVKALLTDTALARLTPGAHFFCPQPDCDIVYLTPSGATYGRQDLRVAVWQKETPGSRMMCYCFGENESGMRDEIAREGATAAAARIRAHIQADRCACEIRNPRGVCCLGDVISTAERLAAAARRSS